MNGPRFDAWTRRRFGQAAGGALAMLLTPPVAGARKRKKRCKTLGAKCKPRGKRRCCGQLRCDATGFAGQLPKVCCKTRGNSCTTDRDCCVGLSCCGAPLVCSEVCFSDRAMKANFGSVDPADMLVRVRSLPISTWNYTADNPSVRHIGPMAQDFAAAFGVGAEDRHIHPLDGQGVALAAIQGLLIQLEEHRRENARLAARIADLEEARG